MASIINAATSGGLISTGDTSGQLQLQTAGTTALTISSGQIATFANPLTSASMPSGSVVQVYNLTAQTTTSTSSTTMVQGPQTATFTLNSNSNKVMVIANFGAYAYSGSALNAYMYSSIYRGSIASGTKLSSTTVIDGNGSVSGQYSGAGGELYQIVTLTYLDTPGGSTTYSVGFANHTGDTSVTLSGYNITLLEIKA
jgi:hypothetical protein